MNNADISRSMVTGVMRTVAALVFIFWSGAIVLQAGTHYVALDGTNDVDNGYITWDGAATQIQWAVSVATNGETVVVSNGTYNLTNQVNIFSNITVRSFTEQGHGSNDTIVNGNFPDYTNRCFYITNGAVLNGFTISNGYAGLFDIGCGGGVYVSNAGAVLNCYIYKNYCSNDTSDYGGGGIYVKCGENQSTLTAGFVSNCTVVSNIVYEGTNASGKGGGGGIYNWGWVISSYISGNRAYSAGGIQHTRSMVTNCTIANNLATNYAGLSCGYSAVRNCLISNNIARTDGGAAWMGISTTIFGSTVISNRAYGKAGGLYLFQGGIASNCQLIGNRASGNGGGAIADGYWGTTVLANSLIRENNSSGSGGGVYHNDATIRNCLIVSNTGIGIYSYLYDGARKYTSVVENCTIVYNSAGGLYLASASNSIRNCIIYSNTTYDMKFGDTAGSNNCWNNCATNLFLSNQGNITNNPMFADWANGDYHLSANSPCINAGLNLNWMTNTYDLDWRARIRYGTVDMGPYELILNGSIYGFR